ncbi:hypothetical protein LOK49_LG06G02639 [Camellia lanceoleosa]|uniref:Uncharacterized protein n=1 Tax=Camellia lanceoleosa TaxID=1840588 RepID=A0ACC0HJK8_9ERIC|nr:hypothetical protein LOK49_LG06G02639 [Camellia lanceoleosa]
MLGHHIIMGSKIGPHVWLTHEEVYDAALQIGSGWSILENGAVYMDPISQNRSFQWRCQHAFEALGDFQHAKERAEDLSCFSWKEFALLFGLRISSI